MADFPPPFDESKHSFEGATRIWMDKDQWTPRLVRAISNVLPPETTISFNYEGDRAWFEASRPADTHAVYRAAVKALNT